MIKLVKGMKFNLFRYSKWWETLSRKFAYFTKTMMELSMKSLKEKCVLLIQKLNNYSKTIKTVTSM